METLDTGKDKIKKISEMLKAETLAPAKQEAQKLIEQAQTEAHKIISEAEKRAENILEEAMKKIEKQKQLCHSSLEQSKKQGVQALKQAIEAKLFNPALTSFIEKNTADPALGAKLISALVAALEKEGTAANFSALIPKQIPAKEVNAHLAKGLLESLREKGVVLGDFLAGVQVKLHDQNLVLDVSDDAIEELLARYVGKDFRELLFQHNKD